MQLPSRSRMTEEMGAPPEKWAGMCHAASMAVVDVMGPEKATVRRGYFNGPIAQDAHFFGRVCQHSWVELCDGRLVDPTRFAFTGGKAWPMWVGFSDEYDIGGCARQPQSPMAPNGWGVEMIFLAVSHTAIKSTGLDFSMEEKQFILADPQGGQAQGVVLTREQLYWLSHLPIREHLSPGQLSKEYAPRIFHAIVDAEESAMIPIDRLDWMCPELSNGRSSF